VPLRKANLPEFVAALQALRDTIENPPQGSWTQQGSPEQLAIRAAAERVTDLLGPSRPPWGETDIDVEGMPLRLEVQLEDLWEKLTYPGFYQAGAGTDRERKEAILLLGDVVAGLEGVMELDDTRPRQPTKAYCMRDGYYVRWNGTSPLRPQLWNLLAYLLSLSRYPVPEESVIEGAGRSVWRQGESVSSKTFSNTFSDLNRGLEPIRFPWEWHIRTGQVYREG
jgi:hypothetical protein